MCGLVGCFGEFSRPLEFTLTHRGPDQRHLFEQYSTWIEFFRLSITGSFSGESPVVSDDGRWICFVNGEIYNFEKLANKYEIATPSDIKVLANGLSLRGLDFLTEIRGMFAGILLDKKDKKTYIFRDFMGEKPLFYYKSLNQFCISSEFRSLLRILDRPLLLDHQSLQSYFRFGYPEEPLTFDVDIKAFPPGAVFEVEPTTFNLQKVLDLPGYNEAEIKVDLTSLLETVLDEILHTEVPSALALSSGIDSTAILWSKYSRGVQSFDPIVVDLPRSPNLSESSVAIENAESLGLRPIVVSSSELGIVEDLKKLAVINDQPHADPSGIHYMRIFRAAQSNGKKVIFLGHGPDEIFWGYSWKTTLLSRNLWMRISSVLEDKRVFDLDFWKTPALAMRLATHIPRRDRKVFNYGSSDKFLNSKNKYLRTRARLAHGYLSHNGLRQSDRLAMAFSIEPRTPFADSRIYGWGQIHGSQAIKNCKDKFEFRSAVKLGNFEKLRFTKKTGFRSDFNLWFALPEVHKLYQDSLETISNFDSSILTKIQVGKLNTQEKYRLLMLGLWLDSLK